MSVRGLVKLGLAGVTMLVAGSALAADYGAPPPSDGGFSGIGGCLYVRLDGGIALAHRPRVEQYQSLGYDPAYGFSDGAGTTGLNQAQNEKLADRGFIEGGIGCQLSDTFRFDVTGGYLFKASLHDPYPNSLSANLETYTGFVNMYYDITNYGGFTPYVGGGVGVAYHELTNLTFPAGARDGSNYDFAWHVTAGMSYDISDSLKLDVAYRYMDLGEARSNSDLGHVSGAGPIAVRDLHDHQIKVGLRYHFGW